MPVVMLIMARHRISLPFLGWALTLGVIYLLLRGSKLIWWFGVTLGLLGIGSTVEVWLSYRTNAAHDPIQRFYLVSAVLQMIAWTLLLLPSTRAFFDLEKRTEPSSKEARSFS